MRVVRVPDPIVQQFRPGWVGSTRSGMQVGERTSDVMVTSAAIRMRLMGGWLGDGNKRNSSGEVGGMGRGDVVQREDE